jgi:hypothetical protein
MGLALPNCRGNRSPRNIGKFNIANTIETINKQEPRDRCNHHPTHNNTHRPIDPKTCPFNSNDASSTAATKIKLRFSLGRLMGRGGGRRVRMVPPIRKQDARRHRHHQNGKSGHGFLPLSKPHHHHTTHLRSGDQEPPWI